MAAASQPPVGHPAPLPVNTTKQEQPASISQVSPARKEPRIKPARTSGSNQNPIFYAITAVLAIALIALGIFYGQGMGKLNKANTQITTLEANVTTLQTQLDAEKATAADLQTKLTAANSQVTSLTADLATANAKVTSLTADLATANAKVTSLTADLATANAKVTSLTADLATANANVTSLTASLATANAKVTTTQASLDKANSDLAAALVANATQAATLRTVQDPRHFNSLTELTNFLAQDDTNTNPAYSALQPSGKAYVLQIKALRAGFLLPAQIDWDATNIYSENIAVIGSGIYEVFASSDTVYYGTSFSYTPPLHPLPLP